MNEKERDAWIAQYEQFYKENPDCPQAKDVDVLNLIMKRNFAEDIKAGKKRVEFRSYSPHYRDRLFDKDVEYYVSLHKDNEKVKKMLDVGIISPMRIVNRIHFHNYNNSWHLDCECVQNGIIALVKEDVKFLQDKFGCHELDDDLAHFEAIGEENRPLLFYFAIGEIGDNNL